VVFAPSEVTEYYKNFTSRKWVVNLTSSLTSNFKRKSVRYRRLKRVPGSGTRCPDDNAFEHKVWSKQNQHIDIYPEDAIISSRLTGVNELCAIVSKKQLKDLIYVGVHLNFCILYRPFGLIRMSAVLKPLFSKSNFYVLLDLTDAFYFETVEHKQIYGYSVILNNTALFSNLCRSSDLFFT